MSLLTRSLFTIAVGLCLVTGSARASQVVFGNLGSNGSENLGDSLSTTAALTWYGHRFSLSAGATFTNLGSVVLGLAANSGGSVSNVSALIYSNSGLNPGSVLFASFSQTVSSKEKYTFDFTGASLAPGGSYWLVLASSGLDWFTVESDETPTEQNNSGYSYVTTRRTTNGGTNWTAFASTGGALSMSLRASDSTPEPIPEPGTWAVAALLVGLAGYARWRRREQAV